MSQDQPIVLDPTYASFDAAARPADLGATHFIGIGGAGMSVLAEMLHAEGVAVDGSDRAHSAKTDRLETLGITVEFGQRAENVAQAETVVYSSAIKPDNPEIVAAHAAGKRIVHRSDILALLMNGKRAVTVAGAHGKTTTSSMLSHILVNAGADPSYAIGGFIQGPDGTTLDGGHAGKGDILVAEADESDGSFAKYHLTIAIITNCEADHLDHYGDEAHYRAAFVAHAGRATGHVIISIDDPDGLAVLEALPGANCGGCGYAGCEGYATAVATDPAVPANRCCAGGAETSIAVGELTGKTVAASDPLVSFRRCDKVAGNVALRYDYQGMPSCAAAAGLVGGSDSCSYSCLGFGDCVQMCPFDAIEVRGGLARVNASKCTGCGKCAETCPRNVLELVPARARVMVFCSTKDRLKAVTEVCKVGCIKCGRCVKSCPAGAVTLENDRIHINHKVCLTYGPECGEACAAACAREALRVLCPSAPLKSEAPAGATSAPGKPLDAKSAAQAAPASQGKAAPAPVQSAPAAPEASPAPAAKENVS